MSNQAAALTVVQPQQQELTTLTSTELIKRRKIIQDVMENVMQDGMHYGTIPGVPKPMMFKAGADLLCNTFRLAPKYLIQRNDIGGGHREYEITTNLYHAVTDQFWGSGLGCASTMERKFRYRKGQENADIADVYNNVLKIAKKRSLVDAILTATGAADMFSHHEEDEEQEERATEQRPPLYLNEQQVKTVLSACESFGVTQDRLKAYLAQEYKSEGFHQIPSVQYNNVLAWLKKQGTGK